MGHGHHIEIKQESFTVPAKGKQFAIILMIVGLILTGIGIATIDKSGKSEHNATTTEATHGKDNHGNGHEAPASHAEGHDNHLTANSPAHTVEHAEEHGNVDTEKFGPRMEYKEENKPWITKIWANLLVAGYFFTMVSLCALFWYAVQYAANAGWSVAIKRVPEAMYTFIPIAFGVLMIAVLLGKNDIYHWVHYEHLHLKPGQPGYDPILAGKSAFLNTGLLFGLPIILVTVWVLIGRKLRKLSLQEDNATKGDTFFFKKSIRFSAAFLVVFGFTISIVAWLFIMSVDAHWYSTIFGVYNFATSWVSSIAFIALFVTYLRSQGYLGLVTQEHMHDLGKFMFAFTVFWAYIWLFQYLLIWYAAIPEEMMYYQIRFEDYKYNFLGNFVVNFVLPFAFLLMRSAKRNPKIMVAIACIMVMGHYYDVWFMVFPGVFGLNQQIGLLELGIFMLFAGLFVYWVLNQLTKRGLVAINHPFLEESVYHDVGV